MPALGEQREEDHHLKTVDRDITLERKTCTQRNGALLAGPGSDGIVVTWKDNFDAFYSEVAELGRYDINYQSLFHKSKITAHCPKAENRMLPPIEVTILCLVLVALCSCDST